MTLSPKKLALTLTVIVICLTLGHVAVQCVKFLGGHDSQKGFLRLLDLEGEGNLPSWYASTTLLLCALFLLQIGRTKKLAGDRYAAHWLGLAAIFFYLSVDEAAAIHEMSSYPLIHALNLPRWLWAGWVLLGGLFVLVVGLVYFRFLLDLPAKTRALFLVAGTLYVGGALGMETFASEHLYRDGKDLLYKVAMVAPEEFMEMMGIVFFLYALASYMAAEAIEVRVVIAEVPPVSESVLVGEPAGAGPRGAG
jgi:hypothetical protein